MSNFARKLRKSSKPSRFGESARRRRQHLAAWDDRRREVYQAEAEHLIALSRWEGEGGTANDDPVAWLWSHTYCEAIGVTLNYPATALGGA